MIRPVIVLQATRATHGAVLALAALRAPETVPVTEIADARTTWMATDATAARVATLPFRKKIPRFGH